MNNIKRRLLCFFLTVVMCFGTMTGMVFAEENVVDDEITDALEVLRLLEIIPDYFDYNTPFETEVSRGEFADTVAKIINLKGYSGGSVYYYDVPKTHFAYDSICELTEMGIINGTEEKIFEPDSPIETMAAYKIILGVMGYGDFIYYNGGYPTGCLSAAQKSGILIRGYKTNLTYSDMFRIIYRALDTEVLKPVSFGTDGSYSTKTFKDETLLSVYHDIYHENGVVEGADLISLSDYTLSKENEALIDGVLYETDLDLTQFLGENIEFYYHVDGKTDTKTVLWAKENGRSDTLSLDIDHNAKFDENTFTYSYAFDKQRTITLDRKLLLIYNGRVVDSDYKSILNKPRYTVKFIKDDGAYKTAIVRAYENYVVDTIDKNNEVVYDKTDASRMLKLNENLYDHIKITKIDGSEATVADIAAGNTLSVFSSADNKRIEIIISVDSKSGTVNTIGKKDGGYEFEVDSKEYYMPLEWFKDNFVVGDTVKLYLDYTGTVAAVDTEVGSSFAAYVAAIKIENIFDTVLTMKLFKSDGTMAIHECASKVKLDGKSGCSAEDVVNALSENGQLVPQLIIAKTAADGKVKSVDTAIFNSDYEQKENSLQQNLAYAQRHYKIQGYFNFEAAINDQTIIFCVPMNSANADDDDYRITRKSALKDDTQLSVMTYNIGTDTGYEKYVVMKENSTLDYEEDLPVLITNKGRSLDKDGSPVASLEGYQGKNLVTVLSNGELSFNDIEPGMLVRFRYMRDGSVAGKTILFDPENPDSYYTTTAPFNNKYGIEVGFVNNVIGDVIKIGYGSGDNISHVSNMYATPPILVYDTENDRKPAYVGSFADAKRYINVGSDCSTVVLITKNCTPRLYVLYN